MLIVGQCELTTALCHHNESKINDKHITDNVHVDDYFYDVKTFTSALLSLLLLSISLT